MSFLRAALVLGLLACTACGASPLVNLAPAPPPQYRLLGLAEGKACGQLWVALPWHQFWGVGLNERIARARNAAIASVPEATGLVDVTFEETWRWKGLTSERCAILRGQAIR